MQTHQEGPVSVEIKDTDKYGVEEADFISANTLKVRVKTNAPKGGGEEQGGYATVMLRDKVDTSWAVIIDGEHVEQPTDVELHVFGDSGVMTLISALEFAAKSLREQVEKNQATKKE